MMPPHVASSERPIDVLAVGGATVDTVITVDRLPSHDEKVMGNLVGHLPGGPAGNFACAASRLGLRVVQLAEVGDDEAGRRIVADFQRYGVDTALIEMIPATRSNFTIGMVDPSGEKAMVVVPMLEEPCRLDRAQTVLPRTRLLFIMPNDRARFAALARLAHDCGVSVMIDVEPTVLGGNAELGSLLRNADIVCFNRDSFTAATGAEPTIAAARPLLELGPKTVVVTLGARGALAVERDAAAECDGYRVDVVDTTGASDTFNAAFARAMLDGAPLATCLQFANAAAALAVTALGPRGHLPNEAEVASFMRRQSSVVSHESSDSSCTLYVVGSSSLPT
jgi:sugar/nucleoside kinase (ribokinase family)